MRTVRLIRQHLLRSASTVLFLRIASMGFTTITGILLARLLQPSEFGVFSYLCAVAALLNVPGSIGVPALMVRELPKYLLKQQEALVNGMLRWGYRSTFLASLSCGIIGIVGIMLSDSSGITFVSTLPIAIPFVAFTVLTTLVPVQAAALRGLGQIFVSQLPGLAEQLLFALSIVLFLMLVRSGITSAAVALYLRVAAEMASFVFAGYLLTHLRARLLTETLVAVRPQEWLRDSYPFVLATGALVINAKLDIAMVGSMIGPKAAGLYQIATKAPELLGIFYLTFGTIAAPRISALYASGSHEELQKLISKGALYMAVGSAAASFVLLISGPWLISALFGHQYQESYPMFAILCLSRMMFNMFGLCDLTLQMLGDQRFVARTTLAMAGGNAILNYALIHIIGLNGAAWATGISLIGWNVILSRRLLKNYALRSGIEGYVRARLRVSKT